MPMVIYGLGDGHTNTHAQTRPHKGNFRKPDARQPATWFKN